MYRYNKIQCGPPVLAKFVRNNIMCKKSSKRQNLTSHLIILTQIKFFKFIKYMYSLRAHINFHSLVVISGLPLAQVLGFHAFRSILSSAFFFNFAYDDSFRNSVVLQFNKEMTVTCS